MGDEPVKPTEDDRSGSESTPNSPPNAPPLPPPNPYLALPTTDWPVISDPDPARLSLSATHELRGGFWYPKMPSVSQEPPAATVLASEATVDEANTLRFALIVWEALQRVSRAILNVDDLSDSARNRLLGERTAYRRVLMFLGFSAEEPPRLDNRHPPQIPPAL